MNRLVGGKAAAAIFHRFAVIAVKRPVPLILQIRQHGLEAGGICNLRACIRYGGEILIKHVRSLTDELLLIDVRFADHGAGKKQI